MSRPSRTAPRADARGCAAKSRCSPSKARRTSGIAATTEAADATASARNRGSASKSGIDSTRGYFRRHRIGGIAILVQHEARRRAIEPAGVEMGQAEAFGETARQRALARRRRAVDRDDKDAAASSGPHPNTPPLRGRGCRGSRSSRRAGHQRENRGSSSRSAPHRRSAPAALAASPRTRNAIAIR